MSHDDKSVPMYAIRICQFSSRIFRDQMFLKLTNKTDQGAGSNAEIIDLEIFEEMLETWFGTIILVSLER